jgi:transcriptional regulator with XRE-family HTH domain
MINSIGERIKYLRSILGFQQEDLANILFIQRGYVSQIETNKQQPSDSLIALIAEKFDVSEDWLRKGEEPMMTELNRRIKKEKARYALETGIGLETVGKRIRFARIYKDVAPSEITLTSKKEDYLYSLESDKKQPTERDMEIIAGYLDVNGEWLATGSGKAGLLERDGSAAPRAESGKPMVFYNVEAVPAFTPDEMLRPYFEKINQLLDVESADEQQQHMRGWIIIQLQKAFPEIAEAVKQGDGASGGNHH